MDNNKIQSMDPYILLSWTNTKLRDEFNDLYLLCEDFDIEDSIIRNKLKDIGYIYNKDRNQFTAV